MYTSDNSIMTFTKESVSDPSYIGTKHLQNLSGEHFRTKSVILYLQYVHEDI